MFWTKPPLEVVEKIVRVKDPLNTELVKAHTALLTEHRALMAEHLTLLNTLRRTPLYGPASDTPLWLSEEQEDARISAETGLRLAPAVPEVNPFNDDRQDEAELRFAYDLIGNAEVH